MSYEILDDVFKPLKSLRQAYESKNLNYTYNAVRDYLDSLNTDIYQKDTAWSEPEKNVVRLLFGKLPDNSMICDELLCSMSQLEKQAQFLRLSETGETRGYRDIQQIIQLTKKGFTTAQIADIMDLPQYTAIPTLTKEEQKSKDEAVKAALTQSGLFD